MSWSKEDTLILSILNQKDDAIAGLDEVDLNRFLDLAREEGLSGYLFKTLKEMGLIHKFPVSIQKSLRESYLLTLTCNIVLMNDLSRVLLALEEKGIRAIVLKGAALLERVYSDIGGRPVMDIDLLFYDGDEKRAGRIFESLGYDLISPLPKVYSNGKTVIDIHTDVDSFTRMGPLPYAPKLNTTSLWEGSSPWGVSFNSVRILSPEDTVLTLSIHFVKHSFLRLLWLIDIIEVIRRNPKIDWKKMEQKARESGFEKLLFYVLSYAKEVFGIIPDHLLSEIKPGKLGLVERRIMDMILRNQRRDGYGDILFFYTIRGTLRRFLYATRVLFPEKEKIIEMSGTRYPYFYYIKRVFELLAMGGKFIWNYIIHPAPTGSPAYQGGEERSHSPEGSDPEATGATVGYPTWCPINPWCGVHSRSVTHKQSAVRSLGGEGL